MKKKVKQLKVKVEKVERVRKDIYLLSFSSPYLVKTALPGNFLQLKLETAILRRPLSIHKLEKDLVFILFRVRGRGTKALSVKKSGDCLDIIGPLGNGFKLGRPESSILTAGGIGVAPLLFLAQGLTKKKNTGKTKDKKLSRKIVLLGARDKEEVVCQKEFKDLGFEVKVATDDGSCGRKGVVTELLQEELSVFDFKLPINLYACGPKEMFYQISRITADLAKIKAQVSFEQFMGCGLGVCCACVIPTKHGYKKVCKDGPVFDLKDI